jgi:hypothetical protein
MSHLFHYIPKINGLPFLTIKAFTNGDILLIANNRQIDV